VPITTGLPARAACFHACIRVGDVVPALHLGGDSPVVERDRQQDRVGIDQLVGELRGEGAGVTLLLSDALRAP
jgi:hypothetical protein